MLAALAPLISCAKQEAALQLSEAKERGQVVPICSLPAISESQDGNRVSIRGRMQVGAHEVYLTDPRCSNVQLDMERAPDGPDITLCTSEALTKQFGCPGGNDNGPIVTVVGILEKSHTPEYANMAVEEMLDFRSVHDVR